MFVSQAMPELILRARPDRRRTERFVHREPVFVDGRAVVGLDISTDGVAVVMRPPVSIGQMVQVSLSGGIPQARPVAARVSRIEKRADRCIVGLKFVR